MSAEMKFKVGDKVRQVGDYYISPIGEIGEVVFVFEGDEFPYWVEYPGLKYSLGDLPYMESELEGVDE